MNPRDRKRMWHSMFQCRVGDSGFGQIAASGIAWFPFLLGLFGAVTGISAGCAASAPKSTPISQVRFVPSAAPRTSSNPSPLAADAGETSAPSTEASTQRASAAPAVECPRSASASEAGTPCGGLHCLAFSDEKAAFAQVLAMQPQVLGIGESHAQKGSEAVPSATRRFAELLLPALCGRAKSIVLEIWLPRNDCGDKRVEKVAKAQKAVTATQAKSNTNEYVTLGHVAKRWGIEPSALVPTCEEYQSILDAGPDTIERMLALIGQRSGDRLVEELHRTVGREPGPVVIAYGGALHNDAEPSPDHKDYSYGPRLLEETRGKYVELDLIVPEYVKDTEVWQRQPWYRAFKENRDLSRTRLYQWSPHSFALVFPATVSRAHQK